MPGFIGFWELLALAAVLLLLFGPRRLPEIGRSLGKGMREFKESITSPLEDVEWTEEGEEPLIEAATGTEGPIPTGTGRRGGRPASARRSGRGRGRRS